MFTHANHTIWYNEIRHIWMLQAGYEIVGEYSTRRGAKIAASLRNRKP